MVSAQVSLLPTRPGKLSPIVLVIVPQAHLYCSLALPDSDLRLVFVDTKLPMPELDQCTLQAVAGCAMIGKSAFGRRLLEQYGAKMPNLRWLHSLTVGCESLVAYAAEGSCGKDLVLTNAKGLFREMLAEWVLAGMLWFARNMPEIIRAKRAHLWCPGKGEPLRGKTCAIIGYGTIGQECGRLAAACGMKILALRRRVHLSAAEQQDGLQVYSPDRLHDLLGKADYVVLALPGTSETSRVIDAAALAAMKPSAVIVNIGRGTSIDQSALIAALDAKQIRGAALDVFEQEPLSADSPLWDMDSVLLTAHSAFKSDDNFLNASLDIFQDLATCFARGQELPNRVDLTLGY